MRVSIATVALMAGCSGDGGGGVHTNTVTNVHTTVVHHTNTVTTTEVPDPTTTVALEQVMRNCPTDAGNICPWVGNGYGGVNPLAGTDVLDVLLSFPMSVAFAPVGVDQPPILSDWNNHRLLALEDGALTVIMGTPFLGDGDPLLADRTPEGAQGTDVALNHPTQQMYLSDGTLLSDSWHTHKFRSWDPATGIVHVVLGSRAGFASYDHDADPNTGNVPYEFGQPASGVLMNQPKELYIDPNNEDLVYYVDMRNERIRLWDRGALTIDTVMGETVESPNDADTVLGTKGYCGEGDAVTVCLNFPKNANPEPGGAIALNADSTILYVGDTENHVIRTLDLTTGQTALLSGTPGTSGYQNGSADAALWSFPSDFAIDHDANVLFVADKGNHMIRAIDLTTLEVTTVAGNGTPTCAPEDNGVCAEQHHAGDGGPAINATLYYPFGVDLDPDGNLIVADTFDHRFRIVYR